jgi:hypothetical protein
MKKASVSDSIYHRPMSYICQRNIILYMPDFGPGKQQCRFHDEMDLYQTHQIDRIGELSNNFASFCILGSMCADL